LPGAALLNILAGRMFGGFYGFLIASAVSTEILLTRDLD